MSLVISSVALCVTVFAASPQTVSKPNPRENAETAVAEAIRVLESKDYTAFLVQFVPPDRLKERGGSPEALTAWVDVFATRADNLLAAFKSARTQKPTYDEARTTATFPMKMEGGPNWLRMVKIGRYWYLANK